MGKLFYFQAPSFDINADSETAPRLGSIFSSLDHLTSPLNRFDRLQIPQSLLNESNNAEFHETDNRTCGTEASLNATALQGIAGFADIVYTFARDKRDVYHCEMLQTLEFEPDRDFVAGSIAASQQVQTFLDDCPFGFKKIYMVTGLKIASGFSKLSTRETEYGPSLKVGVSAAAFGIPIEAGPGLGVSTGSRRTVVHGRTQNKIVFAYRVVRIRPKWDGEPKWKHKSGGRYAVDDDDSDDSDENDEEEWLVEFLNEENQSEEYPESVVVDVTNQ